MPQRSRFLARLHVLAADIRRSRRRPALIFVLGTQRSGTNALRQSLSLDPHVAGFNEREFSRLYENWYLRPEPKIRRYLRQQRRTVLLKPIKSVIHRPIADFLAEFRAYDLKAAWIYRDPVAVYRSRAERWPSQRRRVDEFIADWNRINNSALDAADPRIAFVSFDRLSIDEAAFSTLGVFLGVRGEYLFRSPSPRHEDDLDRAIAERIRAGTAATLARLDAAALAPTPARSTSESDLPSASQRSLATTDVC